MQNKRVDDGYIELANAIIIRAVEDYRMALKAIKRNQNNKKAQDKAGACEKFFRSEWYGILTNIDGELIIDTINREVFGK